MNNQELKVSIIIPVYNKEKYIKKCIDSILEQTYKNFELILVDDGSIDNSDIICKQYTQEDSRIRYLYQTNKGQNAARQSGLQCANEEYVLFMDADDWVETEFLETLLKPLIEEDIPYDLITSGVIFEGDDYAYIKYNGIKSGIYEGDEIDTIRRKFVFDEQSQDLGLTHSMSGKVFKKSKLVSVFDSLDPRLTFCEDGIAIFLYLQQVNTVKVLNYAGYHYIQYEESTVHSFGEEDVWRLMLLKDAYSEIAKQMGIYEDIKHHIARYVYISYLTAVGHTMGLEYSNAFIIPRFLYDKKVQVVIYGAGHRGRQFKKQMKRVSNIECVGWVDRAYKDFPSELNVSPVQDLLTLTFDYVLIAIENRYIVHDVVKNLMDMGISYEKIWPLEKEMRFWLPC